MSSINQMTSTSDLLETTSTHQDLFMDLNEEDAETISGGAKETFTIRNNTGYYITYTVDGKKYTNKPGEGFPIDAFNGGIITFDTDGRENYTLNKSYNLANGKVYAFKYDASTPGNPYDINLYSV